MRRTPRAGLACLSAAALLSGALVDVRGRQGTPPETWQAWRDALETHTAGALDEPARLVAAWSIEALDAVRDRVRRQPDASRLVRRAVVLHTDIALHHRRADGYDLPSGPTTMTLVSDGSKVAEASGTFHWSFLRQLIEDLPDSQDRETVARLFYRATAALLQGWNEDPELSAHLAAARRLLRDDPVLLLIEGTQQQMYAGARAQRYYEIRRRQQEAWRPSGVVSSADGRITRGDAATLPPAFPSAASARSRAEALFRQAVRQMPSLAEARLRLAHVLLDRGRTAEAAGELARVVPGSLPPVLGYYAALLDGRLARTTGDLARAEAAFLDAARLVPAAPTPWLALSEVAMAGGRRDLAVERLSDASRVAAIGEPTDPWWALERIHVPSADTLVDQMRHAFAP